MEYNFIQIISCIFIFFSAVPVIADFAGLRDYVKRIGGDPLKVNPVCPVDLVVSHCVQVDYPEGWENNYYYLKVSYNKWSFKISNKRLFHYSCVGNGEAELLNKYILS